MQYTDFLKRNVARLDSQFTKPPMTAKGKLFLPLNSVYHTFEETQGSFASEDDIIQNWKGDITVEPVYGLVEGVQHGKLRTRPFSKLELTNNFFRKNGRFEKFTTGATRLGKTPRLLHVVDYSEMLHGVKQLDEPLMEFHAFRNYWESFFYNVNRIASADKRYHFIKFDTPTVVPPRSVLQKVEAVEEFNITQASYFIDNVQLLTLSLWRFLAPDRAEVYNAGLFSKLDLSVLDRIHVIFEVGTHYAVMNLGLVASWIKTEANPRGRWKSGEAQIRLLKTMIGFADFKTNTAPAEDDEDDMEDQLHDATKNLDDDVSDDSTALAEQATQQLKKAEFEEGELKKPKGGFYQKPAPKDLASSQPNLAASIRDLIEQDKPDVFLSDNLDAEDKRNLTVDELTEEDLDTLERVQAEALKDKQFGNYVAYAPETPTLDQGVKSRAKEIAAKGLMTSAELRRFEKLSSSYKDIKTPNGQAIDDFINIKPEETKIRPDVKIVNNRTNILDETYTYSSLKHMDKDYIEKFLDRHVYAMMIKSLQNEGLVVKDVKRKHVKTLMDDYYEYSIKVIPVIGEESTATFRIPKVQPDGTIISNGCRYKMRRQRGTLPVCKIAPDEVAMTSYHSKMFVKRSPRVTMSYEKWLVKQVYLGTLLDQPQTSNLVYGNCFNSDIKNQPKAYSALAKVYISFNAGPKGEYAFNFDASQVDQTLAGEHDVKRDEVICGKYKDTILVMDQLGIVESVRGKNRYAIGSIEAIIGVEEGAKVPRDMIEVGPIAGKEIPLGFLLAYYIGLGNLLETLKVKSRRVNKGQRYTLEDDEFVIKFSDQRLIIKDSNRISTMLLNGFNHYHAAVSNHSIWEFDKRDAFLNVFDTQGMGTRHETRLKQVRTHWVDSITGELLRELNYPTDMVLLLIEAAKLLEHDDHPNPNDMRYLRDRGYERIAGMVYTEMMDSLMTFNSRPNNPAAKFSVHPDKVWYAVTTDQTVAPVEDSNPIHSIKEKTVVVSSGAGGRSSQTMTAETRRFHPSQIGVISEATVDNAETGTITYLTSNPNYDSIYGTSQELEKPNESAGQCFSESMLLVPGHKYDD